FLVTDGITEARNSAGEMYTEEGFANFLSKVDTSEDLLEQIKKELLAYTGGEFDDDVSVIKIKVL
ncbi:MAG: SpoIIE family protein phosphatase, partial [Ignavibacteria bacterium]|nr:SpoIIE family protein phosphatase [Ignavibacteria bacterium]